MIHKIREKLNKGSALVFALIILAMLLAIGIAIANVSTRERKLAGVSKASTQAFQVADSGAEIVLRNFENIPTVNGVKKLEDIAGGCDADGKVTGSAAGGDYTITFLDDAGQEFDTCDVLVSNVVGLKSVGSYSGTVRAIQTAVAVGNCAAGTVTEPFLTNLTNGGGFQDFDSDDMADIEDVLNDGGVIAAVQCKSTVAATTIILTASDSFFWMNGGAGDQFNARTNSGASIVCTEGSACQIIDPPSAPRDCNGGWKVIKFCDV